MIGVNDSVWYKINEFSEQLFALTIKWTTVDRNAAISVRWFSQIYFNEPVPQLNYSIVPITR